MYIASSSSNQNFPVMRNELDLSAEFHQLAIQS